MYKADHTCLYVSDLEAERRFYESALDFSLAEERRPNEFIRMMFLEDSTKSYKLQLISGKGPVRQDFGHTAVVCDDFEASYERHLEMGCVKGNVIVQKDKKSYFITDPDGYEIEILNK